MSYKAAGSEIQKRLPLVEIFETVEGEGTQAGYPTVFVRLFGCNLRCVWCDTTYSYPPDHAEQSLSIDEIAAKASVFKSRKLCLTGGEPLLYGERSLQLLQLLSDGSRWDDIHVETNGAIDLHPYIEQIHSPQVRYIMDYKLKGSGEQEKMVLSNLSCLRNQDELKFVIANKTDFNEACQVLEQNDISAVILFSPVFDQLAPAELVNWMLESGLFQVRLNLQLHKWIWHPDQRGV